MRFELDAAPEPDPPASLGLGAAPAAEPPVSLELEAAPELRDAALRVRELEAAHEISQAFLSASEPIEVYRLALARLTRMVRADFAAVFLRDAADPQILRPVAAQGWPQASARYLGRLRIRVGAGPTGRAVAEGRHLEVEDIFADEGLAAWWEAARELGFAAMIALPLTTDADGNEPAGALSFYFGEPRTFSAEERSLLVLIARQLGATSRRAGLVSDLRAEANDLREQLDMLSRCAGEEASRSLARDQLLLEAARELSRSLCAAQAEAAEGGTTEPASTRTAGIAAALETSRDLADYLSLRVGRRSPRSGPEDGARLARDGAAAAGPVPAHVHFTIAAGDTLLPITTDGPSVVRALAILLRQAFRHTVRGAIDLSVRTADDEAVPAIEWLIRIRGLGIESGSGARRQEAGDGERVGGGAESLAMALAGEIAAALGGSLAAETEPGIATLFRFRLPLRHGDA